MRISALIAGAAAAATIAVTPVAAENLKLAITDVEGLEQLLTDWGPFKQALEAASGQTFEFFPVSSRTAAAEALRAIVRAEAAGEESTSSSRARPNMW